MGVIPDKPKVSEKRVKPSGSQLTLSLSVAQVSWTAAA